MLREDKEKGYWDQEKWLESKSALRSGGHESIKVVGRVVIKCVLMKDKGKENSGVPPWSLLK